MDTPNEKKNPAERSEVPNQYSNKLLEFQKRVAAIPKDATNPFFHSKYFNVNTVIEVIKPILNEIGLVVMQPLAILEGKNVLRTEIYDGMILVAFSSILIPEITDIQKFGAALTYLRRYALVSLLLLQGEEDDDGNSATKAPSKPKSAITAPQTSKPSSGASMGLGMTDKQNAKIHVLMKNKGVMRLSDIGIKPIEKPTVSDASMIIDTLEAYQPSSIQIDEPSFMGDEDLPR